MACAATSSDPSSPSARQTKACSPAHASSAGERLVERGLQRGEAPLGQRGHELVLGGELPVHAPDAGARGARDGGHRRVQPALGEDALGCCQQAVALGARVERHPGLVAGWLEDGMHVPLVCRTG